MSKLLVSKNSLKVILGSNTSLRDFMIQNDLGCEPGVDRLIFNYSKDGMNYSNSTPFVTIWWNTIMLKQFSIKLLQLDEKQLTKRCSAATALLAKSILALYLAAGTKILASKHAKFGYRGLKDRNVESKTNMNIMPKALRTGVEAGELSRKSVEQVFSFNANILPSRVVNGTVSDDWILSKQFERLADLSYIWLRKNWNSWCNCFQFHAAAPCGKDIYDMTAIQGDHLRLKIDIDDDEAKVAMHDALFFKDANQLKNDDILRAVCNDKPQFER